MFQVTGVGDVCVGSAGKMYTVIVEDIGLSGCDRSPHVKMRLSVSLNFSLLSLSSYFGHLLRPSPKPII